jgi:hypothetical protein
MKTKDFVLLMMILVSLACLVWAPAMSRFPLIALGLYSLLTLCLSAIILGKLLLGFRFTDPEPYEFIGFFELVMNAALWIVGSVVCLLTLFFHSWIVTLFAFAGMIIGAKVWPPTDRLLQLLQSEKPDAPTDQDGYPEAFDGLKTTQPDITQLDEGAYL